MPTTIESLELEVQSSSTSAIGGIDALSASLSKLKNAVKGGIGLTSVTNQIRNLNTALQGIDGSSAGKLDTLSNSLSKLSGLGSIKISSSIANQLQSIGNAATSLNGVDFSGISRLASSLQPLTTLGKSNLTPFITQLSKLPQLAQTLNTINIPQFASQLNQLSSALAPLASQLNTVSTAFSRLPVNIRSTVTATNAMTAANNTAAKSYVNLWAKLRMAKTAVLGVAHVIASWLTESNKYIEDTNLFTASMGEYAESASKYAEQVGELMGIDPGEWMRNQGTFMTLIKGFGVASDKANMMSRNLTQLTYDLASFENRPFEEAMQKVQSGISGELEPLRNWGYDLSIARLQQEALRLGIDKSVSSMTQAEKAQLRYYAVMTQVTWAQGDMARTLDAPANQLRILQAQLQQCARAMGNLFLPILQKVLPYLIAFAKVLREIIVLFASLFHISLPEFDYSSLSAGSSAIGDFADNADNASDGLGKAAKEAKKLKNALLGIDELNVISPDDNSSSSGSGGSGRGLVGGGDLGIELPDNDKWLEGITSKVDDLVKKFKEWAGLTDDIDTWAKFFHTKLGRILILVGEIAAGFLAWKFAKAFLNGLSWLQNLKNLGLTTPLTLAAGIVLTFTGLTIEWTGLLSIIQDGIDKLNFGEVIGGAIMTAIGGSFVGEAASGLLAKAGITSAAIEGGMGASLAGALFGGGIAAVVAGIPAFVVGVYSSIKEGLSGLSVFLTEFGATLTGAGAGAIGAACGAWAGPIGIAIGALIGIVVGALVNLGIYIYQNWDSIKTKAIQKWNEIVGSVRTIVSNLPLVIRDAFDKIIEFIKDFPQKLQTGLTSIGKFLDSVPGIIKDFFTGLATNIETWFFNLWQPIKNFDWSNLGHTVGEAAGKFLVEMFKLIILTIPSKITELRTEIIEALPKILEVIGEFIIKLPGRLISIYTSVRTGIIDVGVQIVKGIVVGLATIKKAIIDFIAGFFTGLVDGIKEAFGIHSPSTVMQSIGVYIVEGLIGGIESFANMAGLVKEWAGSVVEWFTKGEDGKGPVENFKDTAGDIVSGFKDKVGSTYTNTKSNITTWASNVKSWFSDIASSNAFSGFADNVINGFKNKINTAYINAKSSMTTFADSVKSWFEKPDGNNTLVSKFFDIGKNIIQGFIDGVSSLWDTAMEKIKNFGKSIISKGKEGTEEKSPSKAFKQIGAFVIEGFNIGLKDTMGSSFSLMDTWTNGITAYSPTVGLSVDTSALKYYDSADYARTISANVSANSNNQLFVDESAMKEVMKEAVLQALNDSNLATDMRRQADKEEQTIVQVGNRTVTDAVTTQKKANGYVFAT